LYYLSLSTAPIKDKKGKRNKKRNIIGFIGKKQRKPRNSKSKVKECLVKFLFKKGEYKQ